MNEFIRGDCMDYLPQYADNYFDLAIIDPPYGIGMDGGNVGYKGFNNHKKKNWDKAPPSPDYFKELIRVSRNQIIFGGNYFDLRPSRCFIVWDKGEGFYGRTYAECEMAWTSFDRNAKIFKRDPLALGDYRGKIHPTQKPVQLYKWILRNYAKPDFKILDTHVGSGSSLIAFTDFGAQYIGYEIDAEYHAAACKRLKQHKNQLQLQL